MTYTVAVRALCEFTAKQGDLDLRFTPSPSAREGIEGHAIIASRRHSPYESEITLEGEHGELRVRGRADGFDPEANRLEEVKTYRGDLHRMPDNHRALHWAQVRIYGALLCRARELPELQLALVYFEIGPFAIGQGHETVLCETRSAEWLETYFAEQCECFIAWALRETQHRAERDSLLRELKFPFPEFQGGQRELAESVYRTIRRGGALLAQAPTGIGKTVGTLFPALRAMPEEGLDRIYYLVAKTPGRRLALDALRRIVSSDTHASLRIVELVAREKACEYPDRECHGQSCPLAHGFYDRLAAARAEAVGRGLLDQETIRQVARAHQICPYYLGQELARWSDVVVGDFNYYFDWSASLHALATLHEWKIALLVDEAHNLIERSRAMYSASLDRADFDKALRLAPKVVLRQSLGRLIRAWDSLLDTQPEPYRIHEEIPAALLRALEQFVSAATEVVNEDSPALPPEVLEPYFTALHFCRLAEVFAEHTLFDVSVSPGAGSSAFRHESSTLCLRNVIPQRFLAPRWSAAHASVLFSATLNPHEFYRDVLGLPPETRSVNVASPFSAGQLAVHVVNSVSTRFRDRQHSLEPMVHIMARQIAVQPGNYLAFCGSFDYQRQIAEQFRRLYPDIPSWCQERAMSEDARRDFLARFVRGGNAERRGIGFAVLGGIFGEGIDLPGEQLIGAFIATLGLPQLNPVNEAMRSRMHQRFGAGYEYVYLYPGIQKVIQAAGRVIRTTTDRGVLYLFDDRFAQPQVRDLLPDWWRMRHSA